MLTAWAFIDLPPQLAAGSAYLGTSPFVFPVSLAALPLFSELSAAGLGRNAERLAQQCMLVSCGSPSPLELIPAS